MLVHVAKRKLPTFRETFRDLNRLPFVLGLLALLAAVMGVVCLLGFAVAGSAVPEWWGSPGFVITETILMAVFGVLTIVLYYRFRE